MKCCVCDKEVDEKKHEIPPKWYGKYISCKLLEVICGECIKKPEGRKRWEL